MSERQIPERVLFKVRCLPRKIANQQGYYYRGAKDGDFITCEREPRLVPGQSIKRDCYGYFVDTDVPYRN